MRVTPSTPTTLVVTYNSDNRRPRTFEISVDGRRIARESHPQGSASRFFDVEYRLPAETVADKSKITVRFQATGGNDVATVFGIRSIRTSA